MDIEIDLRKSVQENASDYFEKSKKAKKKLEGINKAMPDVEKKIKKAKKTHSKIPEHKQISKKRSHAWYEKFHWCFTSDNFLVIGGRDAQTNEIVVKKYAEKDDLYFHAEIYGAPHCILRTEGKTPSEESIEEAAQFAATFSSAWKRDFSAIDVYSVTPEQVSKKAPSGESMGTGAFMIYGKRKWFRKTPLTFALGVLEEDNADVLISGPIVSIKSKTKIYVELKQGNLKKSDAAKKVREVFEKKLGRKVHVTMEDFQQMMPSGEFDLTR
ncbi:MAG: NFACT RNA binding domain-containing protein [Candidatus Diapherotrites archaeon]